MVLLVVVRDPDGVEPDDYFFTTDLTMAPATVVSIYASRWAIEVTNRAAKQVVGAHEPQSWKHPGPHPASTSDLEVMRFGRCLGAAWVPGEVGGRYPVLRPRLCPA